MIQSNTYSRTQYETYYEISVIISLKGMNLVLSSGKFHYLSHQSLSQYFLLTNIKFVSLITIGPSKRMIKMYCKYQHYGQIARFRTIRVIAAIPFYYIKLLAV